MDNCSLVGSEKSCPALGLDKMGLTWNLPGLTGNSGYELGSYAPGMADNVSVDPIWNGFH